MGPWTGLRTFAIQIRIPSAPTSDHTHPMLNIGIIGTGFMTVQHLKAYRGISGARVAALCNPSGRHLDGDFSQVAGNVGDKGTAAPRHDPGSGLPAIPPPCSPIPISRPWTSARPREPTWTFRCRAGRRKTCPAGEADGAHPADARHRRCRGSRGERGVFLMPAMCIRFWPEYAWVRERVISGVYGRVRDARFRRVASAPAWGHGHFLQGGESGALMDLHIHDVDFIQHCFGRPHSVMASGYSRSAARWIMLWRCLISRRPCGHASRQLGDGGRVWFNMAFTVNFREGDGGLRPVPRNGCLPSCRGGNRPDGLAVRTDGCRRAKSFVDKVSQGKAPDRVSAATQRPRSRSPPPRRNRSGRVIRWCWVELRSRLALEPVCGQSGRLRMELSHSSRDSWNSPLVPSRPGLSHAVRLDFDGTLSLVRQGWPDIMVPMFAEVIPAIPGRPRSSAASWRSRTSCD